MLGVNLWRMNFADSTVVSLAFLPRERLVASPGLKRRENNAGNKSYRGIKLPFLGYKHGELLPTARHTSSLFR